MLAPHRYCESKRQFSPCWLPIFFEIRLVLVITRCGKKKRNASFLFWCARLTVCGRLGIVRVRLLEVCVSLPVVCGHLRSFIGSLWSFAGGLWSFAGVLWSFVLVCRGLWSLPVLVTTMTGLGFNVLVFRA